MGKSFVEEVWHQHSYIWTNHKTSNKTSRLLDKMFGYNTEHHVCLKQNVTYQNEYLLTTIKYDLTFFFLQSQDLGHFSVDQHFLEWTENTTDI